MNTSLLVVVLGLAWFSGQQPADNRDSDAVRVFDERVEAYAALHRRLEAPLLTLTQTRDVRRNYLARHLLASSLRKARAKVRQGDIFSPDVVLAIRALIDRALADRDVEALLTELNEEHPKAHRLRAVVNGPLPEGATHAMPIVLLAVLPELPEDVEYRIVGHDLVLWDIHADLVVDYLPNAFGPVEMTMR